MFVDTSAWVALVVAADRHHVRAKQILKGLEAGETLVTSDYVFDETINRVRRLAGHRVAVRAGELLQGSAVARIQSVLPEDLERAWQIFKKHEDKELSFTDCTSAAMMERLRLKVVFGFDEDFRKLGYTIVPK